MTNTNRYIPQGYVKFVPEIGDYKKDLFECWVDFSNNCAIFYKGRANKPVFHNRFMNVENMKKRILDTISNLMSWEDMKSERKESRKHETDNIQVGDILYNTWGYEQTNVDFYEVVKKEGRKFIMRSILLKYDSDRSTGNGMAAYVEPIPGAFVNDEEPIVKTSLNMKHGSLSKYEGRSVYCSWYA